MPRALLEARGAAHDRGEAVEHLTVHEPGYGRGFECS